MKEAFTKKQKNIWKQNGQNRIYIKLLRRTGLLTLLFVLVMTGGVFAKPSNRTVMKKYKSFLASGKTYSFKTFHTTYSLGKYYKESKAHKYKLSGSYFNVVDIDQDGIRDLIVKPKKVTGSSSSFYAWYYVFTFKNGKVTPVGAGYSMSFGGFKKSITYNSRYRAIVQDGSMMSIGSWHYLSMRNGSVDDVSNLSWNVDENGNEHYYGDSGTISGSSFQSADATWKNGVKTLKVYKNTKANRKKYLK